MYRRLCCYFMNQICVVSYVQQYNQIHGHARACLMYKSHRYKLSTWTYYYSVICVHLLECKALLYTEILVLPSSKPFCENTFSNGMGILFISVLQCLMSMQLHRLFWILVYVYWWYPLFTYTGGFPSMHFVNFAYQKIFIEHTTYEYMTLLHYHH